MVFHGDIAIASTLIALGVGFLVLVKARKQEDNGTKTLGLIIGWVVIVVAAITLLCASYYSIRYWDDGYYSKPGPMMMQSRMMGGGMMSPGMMNGQMIQPGMMGQGMHADGMCSQCRQKMGQCRQMMQGKSGMMQGKMQGGMHQNGGPGMMQNGMHRGGGSGMMQNMQHPDTTDNEE